MSLKRFLIRGGVLRLFGFVTGVTLCAMIGCGNLGGGCFGDGNVAGDGDGDGWGDEVDNCPDDANADQTDADLDAVGDVCDNCANVANGPAQTGIAGVGDQTDSDADGVGDACDNCPNDPNPSQESTHGNACGDACQDDCGGTTPPVTVVAGSDQIVCPGDAVTLNATSDPLQPNASITWTQIAGPPVYSNNSLDPVINAPDPVTFTAPSTAAIGALFSMAFRATGTASGHLNGTDAVQVTTRPVGTVDLMTKSSGAAQPGDPVTIDLADTESPNLIPVWVQEVSDAIRVNLIQPSGSQSATFSAPQVSLTTSLHFVAVAGCPSAGTGLIRSGALTVAIEVATVELVLPATFQTGHQYNLYDFTLVNGEPTSPAALESVDLTLLFFAVLPGGGELPQEVQVSIDKETGILTVTAGAGHAIEIIAQLWGTAAELVNNEGDGDTVLISN